MDGFAGQAEFSALSYEVAKQNPFFTRAMQEYALRAIAEKFLTEKALEKLLGYVPLDFPKDRKVGLIMAGNVPAVGFHDLLCTLCLGARAYVKLSSKDSLILPAIVGLLGKIAPEISARIFMEGGPFSRSGLLFGGQKMDFLLFSGSDSTKSLLKDEFPGVPMLARGSRFSLGVLSGKEDTSQLELLAQDMFLYCGMGCRSISYLFVPKGFDLQRLVNASSCMKRQLEEIGPYMSNYRRLRAIAQIEGRIGSSSDMGGFIDGGFFLLERSAQPFPPTGCVRFNFYDDFLQVEQFCRTHRDKIQKKYTNFGIAQLPDTDDWTDGINTVEALTAGCTAKD